MTYSAPFYKIIMKKLNVLVFAAMSALMSSGSTAATAAPEKSRQEAVAARGPDVMPFDLNATTHIFTKTKTGGVQKVVARDARNDAQIRLIRAHLQEIAAQFAKGDYSGPTHLHGADMPGLGELKNARAPGFKVQYTAITGGGMIVYTTRTPKLLSALHRWFDAQLSDHGSDAMPGHEHSRMHHH
jgi:hypothetical protein